MVSVFVKNKEIKEGYDIKSKYFGVYFYIRKSQFNLVA